MTDFTIIIGNKNYSSWSLRAWLALKMTGIDFDEVLIALREPGWRERLREHSPSAKVPVLKTPDGAVWESLAICDYLADTFPEAGLWPTDPAARARARAVSSEMHAGFAAVRTLMPMDLRNRLPMPGMTPDLKTEIDRIDAIWSECRETFGAGGPFLFGRPSIADCMYAPVAGRFNSYGPEIPDTAKSYIQAVLDWPPMAGWMAAAREEPWTIDQ